MATSNLQLGNLPEDILHLICEQVYRTSPKTTSSLVLVSRRIHKAALQFIYTSVTLRFPPVLEDEKDTPTPRSDPYGCIASWLHDPSKAFVLRSIRSIIIRSPRPWAREVFPQEDTVNKWRPVAELVSRLTRFARLRFCADEQLPLGLLQAIHKHHPSAKIEIICWCRPDNKGLHQDPAELELARSPCLDTVSLRIYNSEIDEFVKAAFSRMISLAPNLKSIRIGQSSGCYCRSPPEPDPWAGSAVWFENDSYTDEQKKQWTLFKDEAPVRKSVKELKMRGMSLNWRKINGYWAKIIDFSYLESFDSKFGNVYDDFYTEAVAQTLFQNLKHLNLDISARWRKGESRTRFYDAVLGFLQNCPRLKSLGLYGSQLPIEEVDSASGESLPLDAFLPHHAETLRSLSLHAPELWSEDGPRSVLSLQRMAYIRDTCPQLRAFALDINRSHTHDCTHGTEKAKYAMLATFPWLQAVQLNCDLGVARYKKARSRESLSCFRAEKRPLDALPVEEGPLETVDAPFVQQVWNDLFAQKVGKPLTRLVVKVGEWGPDFHGLPSRNRIWAYDSRKVWTATWSERDDAGSRCEISSSQTDCYESIHQDSFSQFWWNSTA